jgi:adenosyl cobinamide kinase/adenosyl cobinamide phosphate guanylyltransferase
MIVFLIGPSQSGKSSLAQEVLRMVPRVGVVAPVPYVGFAPEIQDRIDRLGQSRPEGWLTFEPDGAFEKCLAAVAKGDFAAVLFDGLSLWVGREITEKYDVYPPAMLASHVIKEVTFFLHQLAKLKLPAIVTSSEVGAGISPLTGSARIFQECVGEVHQRCAQLADAVCLVNAGLCTAVKYPPSWGPSVSTPIGARPVLNLMPDEIWKGLSDEVKIRYGGDAALR